MENKKLKADLIKLRNSIQDYLDNMALDEVDDAIKKSEKDKKPEKDDKED